MTPADSFRTRSFIAGILIIHTPPYQPERRGKIERFFRSVRGTRLEIIHHFEKFVIALGMELKLTPELKGIWAQALAQLSGASRRVFMASVIKGLGRGGARQAQIALGWDRTTVRKGLHDWIVVWCVLMRFLNGGVSHWRPRAKRTRPFGPRNFIDG